MIGIYVSVVFFHALKWFQAPKIMRAGGGDGMAWHLIESLFVNSQLMDNLQCHLKSSEFWDMFVQLWPLFIPSVLVYVPAHITVDQRRACSISGLAGRNRGWIPCQVFYHVFCCSDCLQGSSSENRRIFGFGRHHSGIIKGILTLQPERFSHFY